MFAPPLQSAKETMGKVESAGATEQGDPVREQQRSQEKNVLEQCRDHVFRVDGFSKMWSKEGFPRLDKLTPAALRSS